MGGVTIGVRTVSIYFSHPMLPCHRVQVQMCGHAGNLICLLRAQLTKCDVM
jgi:hypothetical protein